MAKILANVQAGQFADDQIRQLESLLRRHYREYVSEAPVSVIWCELPAGQCYTNYELSRSSLVTMECDNQFPQDRREQLLSACANEWAAVTGQDLNEVMVSLFDRDLFQTAVSANQERLSTWGRMRFNSVVLFRLLSAKLRRGFLAFGPNL